MMRAVKRITCHCQDEMAGKAGKHDDAKLED